VSALIVKEISRWMVCLRYHSIQTNGAEIEDNEVSDACYGAFFDPGVKDVRFRNNKLTHAQPLCAPFGASGIILDGAIGARVENNYVEGWKTDDPRTAGLVVADDPCNSEPPSLGCLAIGGPAIASGNRVRGNTLRDNTLDIFVNTTGTGNEFRRNDCDTSNERGICRSVLQGA
jgi:nitrous oxidase accessory protein NosD